MDPDHLTLMLCIRALFDSGVLPRLLGLLGQVYLAKTPPKGSTPPVPQPPPEPPIPPAPLTLVIYNTGPGSVAVQIVNRCDDDEDDHDDLKKSA